MVDALERQEARSSCAVVVFQDESERPPEKHPKNEGAETTMSWGERRETWAKGYS